MQIKRIGIISKPEHARGLCTALGNAKYRYVVLGGDPGLTIPDSCDVIVCRPKSAGHGPVGTALALARSDDMRPVIFENGTRRVLDQLTQIKKGTFQQSVPQHILPKRRKGKRTQAQALEDLIELGGFFFAHMVRLGEQQASLLMQTASTYGDEPCWLNTRADSDPHRALHEVFAGSVHNPKNNLADIRKTKRFHETPLWSVSGKGSFIRVHELYMLSADPVPEDRLEFICGFTGVFSTKAAASEERDRRKWDEYDELAAVREAFVEAHVPEPVKAPEPAPKPVPAPSSEDDVSTLLDMLYEAVKAQGVKHIEHEHFTLDLKVKHLPNPAGVGPRLSVCGHPGGSLSMSLSEVTCEDCAKTPTYHEMVWILENMDY